MKKLYPLLFSILYLAQVTYKPCWSEEISLFNSGKAYHRDYNRIVAELSRMEGDAEYFKKRSLSLCFSNKKCWPIKNVLGSGNTTVILDVGNGKVIRVAKRVGTFSEFYFFSDYIRMFAKGYEALAQQKVRVPHLFLAESNIPEYVLVEKIDTDFTLFDLTRGKTRHKKEIPPAVREKAWKKFIDFAESTWPFGRLSDFHGKQISYSEKTGEWTLFDWADQHIPYRQLEKGETAFVPSQKELPAQYYAQIQQRILTKRKQAELANSIGFRFNNWCRQKRGLAALPADNATLSQ